MISVNNVKDFTARFESVAPHADTTLGSELNGVFLRARANHLTFWATDRSTLASAHIPTLDTMTTDDEFTVRVEVKEVRASLKSANFSPNVPLSLEVIEMDGSEHLKVSGYNASHNTKIVLINILGEEYGHKESIDGVWAMLKNGLEDTNSPVPHYTISNRNLTQITASAKVIKDHNRNDVRINITPVNNSSNELMSLVTFSNTPWWRASVAIQSFSKDGIAPAFPVFPGDEEGKES